MKTNIILCLICLLCLIGCSSPRKAVTEAVHDTVRVAHTDTLFRDRVQYRVRDSIIHDSVILTQDTGGKVIYKEVYRDRIKTVNHTDTVIVYKAVRDSARISANNARTELKTEVKHQHKGWTAFGLVCALFVACIGIIIYRSHK